MAISARGPPKAHVIDEARPRPSGVPGIDDLPWGAHFCHFYEQRQDLLDILIPYFTAGLDAGEYCLWVSCDELDPDRAIREFRKHVADADLRLESGQMEIISGEGWYLNHGAFDPRQTLNAIDRKLQEALDLGYSGMRLHGDEAWLTLKTWNDFARYEATLDEFLRGKRLLVLCTYPLEGISGGELFDIAKTHQFSVARRHGDWEIMETAESVRTKSALEQINADLEALVEERSAKLARKQTLYRILAENMNEAITVFDTNRNRIYVSPSYAQVVGENPINGFDNIHPQDRAAVDHAWDKALEGNPQSVTYRHIRRDGSIHWLECSVMLAEFEGDMRMLAVTRDVTERISLEEQLNHAQKMEALGRLAGGVAHDFNNLLTAIYGYAELAISDLPPNHAANMSVSEIKLAAERAQRVTGQLLIFSRRDTRQPQVVDVQTLLRGLEQMFRLLLRENIIFELQLSDEALPVFIDPAQLEQLLVNLVANARDATSAGGKVSISADRIDTSDRPTGLPAFVTPGRYARIRVSDTGSGMSEDSVAKAFDPFFTTKPPGVGTGLGLSMVFGIAKHAGGYVWIDSEQLRGTIVSVLLPLSALAAEPAQTPAIARRSTLRGKKILVVEDEELVLHFVRDVLERNGVIVVSAKTPAEALEFLGDDSSRFDALLTDVVMPGMTGPALVRLAHQSFPDLPAVLMSGYTADEDVLTDPSSAVALLEKPFRPDELLDHLSRAVTREKAESRKRRPGARRRVPKRTRKGPARRG